MPIKGKLISTSTMKNINLDIPPPIMVHSHCPTPSRIQRLEPQIQINKKVLLRERKRHTDRRVASTRYAAPAGGGGGGGGGYPG